MNTQPGTSLRRSKLLFPLRCHGEVREYTRFPTIRLIAVVPYATSCSGLGPLQGQTPHTQEAPAALRELLCPKQPQTTDHGPITQRGQPSRPHSRRPALSVAAVASEQPGWAVRAEPLQRVLAPALNLHTVFAKGY